MPTHTGAEHLWREIRPPPPPKRQGQVWGKGGVARMHNPIDWLWPLTEENNQNLMAASLRWAKAVNFITNSYSYYLSLCCDGVPVFVLFPFALTHERTAAKPQQLGSKAHSQHLGDQRRDSVLPGSPRVPLQLLPGHQHRPPRHSAAIQPHRLSIRSRRDPLLLTDELPVAAEEFHLRTGCRKCEGMSSAQGDHTPGTRPPSHRPTHTL